MLSILDEFTHECPAIRIDRKLNSTEVIDVLCDQFILRGVPGHIRSDNGPEFVPEAVQKWIKAVGARPPISNQGHPGRKATSRASMRGSGMNCSMGSSSAPSQRPRSSSNGSGIITTPSGPTAHWDTGRRPPSRRPIAGQADDELTFKPDQSNGGLPQSQSALTAA